MAAPTFNVFIGSETGLLKGINTVKEYWTNLNTVATPEKSNEIRSLTWVGEDESEICVGLRNKRIATVKLTDNSFSEFQQFEQGDGDLRTAFFDRSTIVLALESGVVNVWKDGELIQDIKTGSNLTCMVRDPAQPNTISTGGKEADLKLWDLSKPKEPVFLAKNVKNDWLNLRVPIWITGIGFLGYRKIVTCTGYHQVRVYDPQSQRRPVLDMSWDEYPITAMSLYRDNQVVVGNTHGSMALLDIRTGKLVHNFKGFAGSIRSIQCHSSQPVVASCGLDRFFRVHDINSRELIHKKYLKSRLNCMIMTSMKWQDLDSESAVEQTSTEQNILVGTVEQTPVGKDTEDNEDEIWNQMEIVKTKTMKRKDVVSEKDSVKEKKTKNEKEMNCLFELYC